MTVPAYDIAGGSDAAGALRSDFLNFAATLIQSAFRGYVQRKSFTALKRQSRALQLAWLSRDKARIEKSLAATILQRAWRAFSGKKMLAYYKNLIAVHEHGDPREVLKIVSPREADMMDAAAGLHVRFRLDGSVYPPRLMYKIFTHRPVADICAFCPRDYAGVSLAATPTTNGGNFHTNHVVFAGSPEEPHSINYPRSWYHRHENNAWRPVDSSSNARYEPSLPSQRRCQPAFHYCSKTRAAQRLHKQKVRRRQWLVSLYSEHADLGPEDERFCETEDATLMEWCDGLDYDRYISDWRSLATTMASEAFVPIDETMPELPAWSGALAPYQGIHV